MRTEVARGGIDSPSAGSSLGDAVLLAWNVWRFDWLRGYDAYANDRYARRRRGRVPAAVGWTSRASGTHRRSGSRSPAACGASASARLGAPATAGSAARRGRRARDLCARAPSRAGALAGAAEPPPRRARASPRRRPRSSAPPRCTTPRPSRVALATGRVLRLRCAGSGADGRLGRAVAAGALFGLAALTRGWALPVLVAVAVRRLRARRLGPSPELRGRRSLLAAALARSRGSVARQPATRARERARVQPPRPGGARSSRGDRRASTSARACSACSTTRHAALPQRARPAPLRRLVGRLGADVGQPACRPRMHELLAVARRSQSARGRRSSASSRRLLALGGILRARRSSRSSAPLGRPRRPSPHRVRRRGVRISSSPCAYPVDRRRHDQGDVPADGAARRRRSGRAFVVDALRPRGRPCGRSMLVVALAVWSHSPSSRSRSLTRRPRAGTTLARCAHRARAPEHRPAADLRRDRGGRDRRRAERDRVSGDRRVRRASRRSTTREGLVEDGRAARGDRQLLHAARVLRRRRRRDRARRAARARPPGARRPARERPRRGRHGAAAPARARAPALAGTASCCTSRRSSSSSRVPWS